MIDFQYLSIPLNCSQLVHVRKTTEDSPVCLSSYQLENGQWKNTGHDQRVNIGANGFAGPRRKREGDMKTPTGLFKIGLSFGYGDFCLTGLDYRKIEDKHYWIDDAEHQGYNTWVDQKPDCSAEKMLREDGLYRYGFVIEYNTYPIVPGRGSAIFAHIEKGSGIATHGCVSMPEDFLAGLLTWLDKKCNPHILMGI